MKKTYVLGFAFLPYGDVVLLQKKKPDFQKGRLNGVGGAVEKLDVSAVAAMVREFTEETGVVTERGAWVEFAQLSFPDSTVYCYTAFSPQFKGCHTTTGEPVFILPPGVVSAYRHMANLSWLLPMAWQRHTHRLSHPNQPELPVYYVEEL